LKISYFEDDDPHRKNKQSVGEIKQQYI